MIKSILSYYFEKRLSLSRFSLNVIVLIALSIGGAVGGYIVMSDYVIPRVFAASAWTQNDWSGSADPTGVYTASTTNYGVASDSSLSASGVQLESKDDWADDLGNWPYRAEVTLTNGNGSELTDTQFYVTVDTETLISASKMESACEDLRLADSDGNTLNYWIETGEYACDDTDTRVWSKMTIPDGGTTIYLYYGYPSATDAQDGDSVFEFFDDFEDASIDSDKWQQGTIGATSGTNFSESGGLLRGGNTNRYIQSTSTFTGSFIAESRVYEDSSAGNGYTSVGFWASTSNSWGILIHNGTTYLRNNGSWPNFGTFSRDKWSRDMVRVIGTSGYAERRAEDDTDLRTYSNTNSGGISNEYLRLSTRYDNGTYNQNYDGYWDWIFVRKGISSDSTGTVTGSEEANLAASSSMESVIWDGGSGGSYWEAIEFSTTESANVTVKARTQAEGDTDFTDAPDWSSCTALEDQDDMALTDTTCIIDGHRYIQYYIAMTPNGTTSPSLSDITLNYSPYDTTIPSDPSAIEMYVENDVSAREIPSSGSPNWNNSATPYFTWTSSTDTGGSGLLGYCLYLGTDSGADPGNKISQTGTSGILDSNTSPVDADDNYCEFIVGSNSFDMAESDYLSSAMSTGTTYYFIVKSVDGAGNTSSGSTSFSFKYDGTNPTNVGYISAPSSTFNNVVDMFFSWPTSGSGQATDSAGAGLLGYQYQINASGDDGWLGTDSDSYCDFDYIPAATASYTLTELQDDANITEGNNIVYFRAVDSACNSSPANTYRTANLAFGGDAPAFSTSCQATNGITITPTTNTTNSFALSWEAASPADGQVITNYYYMINTTPPSSLSTITSNASTYIDNETNNSVIANRLTGAVKGSNTVYVVAVDDGDNYSPSNCLKGEFTLNSTLPDPPLNLSVSDASIKASSLWRASLGWDVPAYTGTGSLTYKVQRSSDGTNWTDVTTTAGNSYIDTVSTSSLFYWRVGAYDTSSESVASPTYATAVSLTPKGTYTDAPDLSSGPSVSSVTTKKATITWGTSRTADSKVQYGTNSGEYFDEEPSNSSQVTDHSIQLSGLNPGTTYYYRAKWTDEDGNTGESEEKTFTTDPAPTVTEPAVTNIGLESATITFTSTGATSARIYYGITSSFGGVTEISTSTNESTYTVQLSGLEDGTKYFYKINTFDSEEEEYEGSILSFETLPRPRIDTVRVQQVKGTAQPTVLVSWQTNTAVSSIVTYYPVGSPASARDEVNVSLTEGAHQMIVRGLLPNTNYTLIVKGRDKVGNEAVADALTITTATDTRPPKISNLKVEGTIQRSGEEGVSTAQLIVSWDTDEPATSQVEYGEGTGVTYAMRSQEDSNLTFNHVVILSGLTPSKVYHLRAISKDSQGNEGLSVDTVTITPKASRSALDLVITNLSEAFGFIRGR